MSAPTAITRSAISADDLAAIAAHTRRPRRGNAEDAAEERQRRFDAWADAEAGLVERPERVGWLR